MRVAILNAGEQTDYLHGLVRGLASIDGLSLEVVDGDRASGLFDDLPAVTFLPLRGSQHPSDPLLRKAAGILRYYGRLAAFALRSRAEVFHIQWDNSILLFDRTLLLAWYRACGKKLVRTVHNVDPDARDGRPSRVRAWSLRRLYHHVDRLIVHTERMKEELAAGFGVPREAVRVIPHGMNDRVRRTGMTRADARRGLGIGPDRKVLLFFGYIDRYKGLDLLVDAFALLRREDPSLTLLVAGAPKRSDGHLRSIERSIADRGLDGAVVRRLQFVPDAEVEQYFAAADCLVLPYRNIFQSGVLFLSYRFGLPVVATDVGSFREDIREGEDGFIAATPSAEDIAGALRTFFCSPLYADANARRPRIRAEAERRYAWTASARMTADVYREVLGVGKEDAR